MQIEADAWLAEIMGYPVFRVSVGETPPSSAEARSALAQATGQQRAFMYAKLPTQRVAAVHVLEAAGFNVVDVNVTLAHSLREVASASSFTIRPARPEDHAAVLNIAVTAFVYSRFHLDPKIPAALANEIKRAWVENYCLGKRGEGLWLAEAEGKVVGFLALLISHTARVIDLIGVSPAAQRRGVGEALVRWMTHDSVGKFTQARVGTQAANIPSLRLYEKCGFSVAETTYVLHGHWPQ